MRSRWLLLAGATLATLGLGGCRDKGDADEKAFQVQVDPSDSVLCGFGQSKTAGPWDEVSLRGDGKIKWTHLDPISGTVSQQGFEKDGELGADETKQWLQGVVDLGLFDMAERKKAGADGPSTQIAATIDGHNLKVHIEGLPDEALRARLDELTAQTIRGR